MNMREQICEEFYNHPLMAEIGAKRLPNIGGSLSTTFSPTVFGQVHVPYDVTVVGANTAIRPTDFDGGTHLPCFSQLYIATNQDLSDKQEGYVSQILNDIVKSVSSLPIDELKVVSTEYAWHADSTGYSGGGYQMDVREAVIDGQTYDIGRLEIAQLNDYNQSGTIKGRASHLIVFGIDRIINLIRICEAVYEGRSVDFNDTAYLYDLSDDQTDWYKHFINRLAVVPKNASEILGVISDGFKQIDIEEDFSVFAKLGRINTLMECAYAANIITSGHRNYFIREARKLYRGLAEAILNNPDSFRAYVASQIEKAHEEGQVWTPDPAMDAFQFVPKIPELFPRIKVTRHDVPDQDNTLLPFDLLKIYLSREFGNSGEISRQTPAVANKMAQLENIFVTDFATDYRNRRSQFPFINTRIGTLHNREETIISVLWQVFRSAGQQFDTKAVRDLVGHYLTEFTYRAHKLHPFLKGHCAPTQMELEGIANEQTCMDVTTLHHISKLSDRITRIQDANMLAAIGAIYLTEACLYYAVSEKNPSTKDPDGIKSKLSVALFALKALGMEASTIEELVDFIIDNSALSKPTDYLKNRIRAHKMPPLNILADKEASSQGSVFKEAA